MLCRGIRSAALVRQERPPCDRDRRCCGPHYLVVRRGGGETLEDKQVKQVWPLPVGAVSGQRNSDESGVGRSGDHGCHPRRRRMRVGVVGDEQDWGGESTEGLERHGRARALFHRDVWRTDQLLPLSGRGGRFGPVARAPLADPRTAGGARKGARVDGCPQQRSHR